MNSSRPLGFLTCQIRQSFLCSRPLRDPTRSFRAFATDSYKIQPKRTSPADFQLSCRRQRQSLIQPRTLASLRQYSTSTTSNVPAAQPNVEPIAAEEPPSYQMTFTCKPCMNRSSHKISKQGYHHGAVLITCPHCKNRHVISDHLGIFSDSKVTVEDILKAKGELVKRGTLGQDGDIEFWEDGSKVGVLGGQEGGKGQVQAER